jgi:16S rRNA (guanine1207-N2)-methyltransferase
MSDSAALDTLFLPFDEGTLDWVDDTLFLYADWHPSLQKPCDVLHVFKPCVDRLAAHGFENLPHLTRRDYAQILIHIPKQVSEAKGLIAQALDHLKEGGTLVLAADNDANGKRLKGWLADAGLIHINEESKNKARVVWTVKNAGITPPQDWLEAMAVRLVGGYYTRPGLFSWDAIDPASQLLAEQLPSLSGTVADFGCGWGYLSCEVLKRAKNLNALYMIDADSRAVACAQANTEEWAAQVQTTPLWHDLTQNLPENVPSLDFIVMNPPFHTGKKTDLDLGLSFIRTAETSLKKGGVLFIVANAHLRYEEELGKLFKSVEQVIQKGGFKILKAIK